MTTNKELLKQISIAFAKANMEFAASYLAADIKWNILGYGTITGKEQALEVAKMLDLEAYPVITIKKIISDGNFVVVESTGEATTKKGDPYNQSYCDIFEFKNDKLQEITTYLDTALSNKVLS